MTEFFRGRGRIVLLASASLLAACSSSVGNETSGNTAAPATAPAAPPPAVSTPVSQAPISATYDTSIGTGVDAYGYANLPLRAGAHRYFVSSATGSDSNGCGSAQNAATPLRSIAAGIACVQGGNGDQLLVAEGTSYAEGLPNLDSRAGYNASYPTVLESYDPSDPLNEDKYGRAANGRRPVVNTGANGQTITCCSVTPASYLAIRGFDINPGDRPDMSLTIIGSNGLPNNYILIENNLFRYTTLVLNQPGAAHHIVRKNAFYGEWSPTAHAQGVFSGGTDAVTVEDNVFWHVGWKLGVSRDTDPSLGGPTIFRHSIYQQDNSNAVIRRNFFMDPSATGCSCRGDTSIQENVFIDNPISIIAGLGDNYNTIRPNGVAVDVGYNAILGDADINSLNPRGMAIQTGNGKQGSAVHNNLIARSRNPSGMNVFAFSIVATYAQPSYADFRDNLEYLWSAPGYVKSSDGPYAAADNFPTYANNKWSDPASGTNTNSAGLSFPNAYTEAQLFAALGCSDKATCAARMVETPEQNWAVKARTLLWQGYGLQ